MPRIHWPSWFTFGLRNFVSHRWSMIELHGFTPQDFLAVLTGKGVPDPGALLHECCHMTQVNTPVGTAMYFSQFRFGKDAARLRSPDAWTGRRYRFCKTMLEPISEGLALFSQFDFYPSDGSISWADDLMRLLPTISKAQNHDFYHEKLILTLPKKSELLLADLAKPNARILGYVWIK